jgi:hypothetical protein
MDVMVLQRGDDATGWTTVGHGLAVDGRHALLRVDPAGPVSAGPVSDSPAGSGSAGSGSAGSGSARAGAPRPVPPHSRLRLLALGPDGVEAERLTGVQSLPQDGWSLTVARTAGPDRPHRPAAEVLDLLNDRAHVQWAPVAGAPDGPVRGGTTVAAPPLEEPFAESPEPSLSWLCRIFRIDCPSVVAG